jgi:hypothetical protein
MRTGQGDDSAQDHETTASHLWCTPCEPFLQVAQRFPGADRLSRGAQISGFLKDVPRQVFPVSDGSHRLNHGVCILPCPLHRAIRMPWPHKTAIQPDSLLQPPRQ